MVKTSMLKKWLGIMGVIVVPVVIFIAIRFSHHPHPPERPSKVPVTAVWDGGPDGGNWIDCIPRRDSVNQFFCTAYSDYNGDILYKGYFKLEGQPITLQGLRNLLGVYSGDYIFLHDNRILKAIDSSSYEEMMKRQSPAQTTDRRVKG